MLFFPNWRTTILLNHLSQVNMLNKFTLLLVICFNEAHPRAIRGTALSKHPGHLSPLRKEKTLRRSVGCQVTSSFWLSFRTAPLLQETWQGTNTAGPLLSGNHHVPYLLQKLPFGFHQEALFNVGIILMTLLLSQGRHCDYHPQNSTEDRILSIDAKRREQTEYAVCCAGPFQLMIIYCHGESENYAEWNTGETAEAVSLAFFFLLWTEQLTFHWCFTQSPVDLAMSTLFTTVSPPLHPSTELCWW